MKISANPLYFYICTGKRWWLQLYWCLYNVFAHFEWRDKRNFVVLTERHPPASSRADILPDIGHAAFRCFVTNSLMVKMLNRIFSGLMFRPLQKKICLFCRNYCAHKAVSCQRRATCQRWYAWMSKHFLYCEQCFMRHDTTKQSVLKFLIIQGALISIS